MSVQTVSLTLSGSSDATFRAWGLGVRNALLALGLTRTADTGQVDWTTVTTAAGVRGYEVWQFNDALQTGSTKVFLRLEYGNSYTATAPALSIQAGTGTDGAGNLTGAGAKFAYCSSAASGSAQSCIFSGDTDRLIFYLGHSAANHGCLMFVERLKDSSGANNSVGFAYGCHGPTGYSGTGFTEAHGIQAVEFGLGVPPAQVQAIFPVAAYTTGATTTQWNNSVVLMPCLPMGSQIHNPLSQLLGYLNADITTGSTPSATVYGTSRTFLALGGAATTAVVGTATGRPLMAYW